MMHLVGAAPCAIKNLEVPRAPLASGPVGRAEKVVVVVVVVVVWWWWWCCCCCCCW